MAETWIAEFDGIAAGGGRFVLTMHPWIVGRPSRMAGLARMIEHIQRRQDIWWTTKSSWPRTSCVHRDEVAYFLDPAALPAAGPAAVAPS